MPATQRILIVDDDPVVSDALAKRLAQWGHDAAAATTAEEALRMLEDASARAAEHFGIVISDLDHPHESGLGLVKHLRQHHEDVVPILITGFGKVESAVQAMRLGAADYLMKPLVENELKEAVDAAVQRHALLAENRDLKQRLSERYGMGALVGSAPQMQKVYGLVEAVAPSDTTVLIDGESGTGKSVVARAIHAAGPRAAGPFVTFCCGSIPEALLESELFGHVKGAFTGADRDKPGKVMQADGGTLLIDEINSATPALQLKLLRVLQDKCFEPVGSGTTEHVDVRFIVAANEDLVSLVRRGTFREDLFYRVNVVNLAMPALRDRPGDIALLAEHFLARFCEKLKRERRLSEEAVEALRAHTWPGNVRELENVMERAVVLSRTPMIEVEDLPESLTPRAGGSAVLRGLSGIEAGSLPDGSRGLMMPCLEDGWTPTPLVEALKEPERQILLAALGHNGWNRQETARQLGINRTTLYKKIKQYRLDEPG